MNEHPVSGSAQRTVNGCLWVFPAKAGSMNERPLSGSGDPGVNVSKWVLLADAAEAAPTVDIQ